MPPTLEERVAYLEGKMGEQSQSFGEIRESIVHLDGRVDALGLRIDALDQKLDRRVDALDKRIDALDHKVDRFRAELADRIDSLDQKVSRHFTWLVGIQITVLLSVIAALLAR